MLLHLQGGGKIRAWEGEYQLIWVIFELWITVTHFCQNWPQFSIVLTFPVTKAIPPGNKDETLVREFQEGLLTHLLSPIKCIIKMPSLLPSKGGSSVSLHLHEHSGQSDLPLKYYTLNTLFFPWNRNNPVIPHLLFPERQERFHETEKYNDFIKVPLKKIKKVKAVAPIGEGGANNCSLFCAL